MDEKLKESEKKDEKKDESTTILDYISWRGDLSMTERSFNQVDDLILSELSYLDLKGILNNYEDTMSIHDIATRYDELGKTQEYLANNPAILLRAVKDTRRFGGIRAGLYSDKLDALSALQFAAITFFLEDGSLYIAFRGTDNTIVGWKEDFTMLYLDATPGQIESALYLEKILNSFDRKIHVGGHSKGGSFAVYAAAFAKSDRKSNILSIVSHDGPGLSDEAIEKKEYEEILDRTMVYLPEGSAIGILLSSKAKKCFIKSNAKGIMQHNPYSWVVGRDSFVLAQKRTAGSTMLEELFGQWLDELSLKQRENMVSALFDAIDASGAETITEVNSNQWEYYNAIFRNILSFDAERKNILKESLQKLIGTGNEVLKKEAGLRLKEIFKTDMLKIKNPLHKDNV